MRFLCLGDVVGRPGRIGLKHGLPQLKAEFSPDVVIVNGENAAGGLGLDSRTAEEIKASGADVITLGDHAFQKKEITALLASESNWIVRPANYPEGAPGKGCLVFTTSGGIRIGVINLLGRVFMNATLDCPFRTARQLVNSQLSDCKVIICDMHAEATSEKEALAKFLDGRLSLVFGTHTHVQTADERILAGGTGFITDLGMCGSMEGIIGMDAEVAVSRFTSGLPHSYEVAKGEPILQGVVCDIDETSGKATRIERVRLRPQIHS